MSTPGRLFVVIIGGSAALVVATAPWSDRSDDPSPRRAGFNQVEGGVPVSGVPLGAGVRVRDQLALSDLGRLAEAGVRTVISLRPDGEEPGQPTARAVGVAATPHGIKVIYLPTPASHVPDDVADQLARHLEVAGPDVLLYCGSGWRAARAWALAEASRPGGRDVPSILQVVRTARHDIDDLSPRIEARFKNRKL